MSRRRLNPSETVADYDVRSPAVRTIATVLGTVVAVGLLIALVLALSIIRRESRVATSQIDVGTNATLVINASTADLEIVIGEPDLLTVTATVTSGLRKTDYQVGRKGDEVKIVSSCQEWLNPGCGVSARLQVPPGMPLDIRTTSGSIRAEGIAEGVLTVRTTSGDIVAEGLKVDEFSAASDTGSIRAMFDGQPFGFKATTKDGDITADLPSGDITYAVTTTSKSGNVSSDFDSAKDAAGFIRVTSVTGDIRLTTSS